MEMANHGMDTTSLDVSAFVASFRNRGAMMREPREKNMKKNATPTRNRCSP